MTGQADHPHADHRAVEMPGQTGDRRVGLAAPAEEGDVDAAGEMLVDQHADMQARGPARRPSPSPPARGCGSTGPSARRGCARSRRARSGCSASGTPPRTAGRARARRPPAVPSSPDARRSTAPACHRRAASMNTRRVIGDDAAGVRVRRDRNPRCAARCTYSPATRPRLSHASRRVASIQAVSCSGKAARRLAGPMRCAGSHGPIVRATAPHRSRRAVRVAQARSQREQRTARMPPTMRSPSSAARVAASCQRQSSTRILPNTSRRSSRSTPARKSSSG